MLHPKYYPLAVWSGVACALVLVAVVFFSLGSADFLGGLMLVGAGYCLYQGWARSQRWPEGAGTSSQQPPQQLSAVSSETSVNVAAQTRSAVLQTMLAKGYQIDKEGAGYIQFRKPRGSVLGNVLFFLMAATLAAIIPPLGGLLLLIWFVRLIFIVARPSVQTIQVTD